MLTVLSLFDGISCARYSLGCLGIPVNYYASEISQPAELISKSNYPDIIRLGDVTNWRNWDIDWSSIGLLLAGSPCQGFSSAGKAGGTKATVNGTEYVIDTRDKYLWAKSHNAVFLSESHLFWEFVLILDHVKAHNPGVRFMLENVKMSKNNLDMITTALGVEPVFINSALVSAQNRQRYYWCNWYVPQPVDLGIVLADIIEQDVSDTYMHTDDAIKYMNRVGSTGRVKWSYSYHSDTAKDKSQCVTANFHRGVPNNVLIVRPAAMVGRRIDSDGVRKDYSDITPVQCLKVQDHGKSRCVSTVAKDSLVSNLPAGRYPVKYNRIDGNKGAIDKAFSICSSDYRGINRNQTGNAITDGTHYRKLTPIECERLQGLPDNYTAYVSNTQRYIALGNGWQCDTIKHLFFWLLIDHCFTESFVMTTAKQLCLDRDRDVPNSRDIKDATNMVRGWNVIRESLNLKNGR